MRNSAGIGCCVLAAWLISLPAAADEHVVIEWHFDKDGDLLGWRPGGHVADAAVRDGALRGRVTDWDPILLGPVVEIPASVTQRVEIIMWASEGGQAELFWTETLEGRFGGFGQEKRMAFSCVPGDQFRTYLVHPFWHAAGTIVRLRLDVPASGNFAIASIRIVDSPAPSSSSKRWQFDSGTHGWRPWQDVASISSGLQGLTILASGERPTIVSPLLSIPGEANPIVCIRMAVEPSSRLRPRSGPGCQGRLLCANRSQFGTDEITFPVKADGKTHTYNVDMGGLRRWRGEVVVLGVEPTDSSPARLSIESIEIADDVRGPAELELRYFGKAEGVNRVGSAAEILATVRNLGGTVAEGVTARLAVPPGTTVTDGRVKRFDPISLYLPKTVSWHVMAQQPGPVEMSVRLEGPGVDPVEAACRIEFTTKPDLPPAASVPEPMPVTPVVDVGAFYFPGWHSASRWAPIRDYPMRKPVLGWYDESNPECADWQIKWAVEHGVTFFMVDWYWSAGHRHLEHWVHDAYMKSRHRRYLKWAVMWANHNAPGTHSPEDWRNVTQYWIDNYFGIEEYYCIDGKPAVFIWSPQNIRRDVGGSDEAARLYALSQQMARKAGYPGICFVAMSSHDSPGRCRELSSEGYQAFTSYHGFQLAERMLGAKYFSFEQVVRTAPQVWADADARAGQLEYFPIVDTGWSSEPWHHSAARVIHGRTPELFGELCRAARRYAEQSGKRIIAVGPWNEWGEGSYIEPYAEHGFADLDAMRAAFCPPGDYPPNLVAGDVGLGPYDLSFPPPKTAWEFNTDGDLEGWTPNGSLTTKVAGNLLVGRTVGGDSILTGPAVQIDARQMHTLRIRIKSDTADVAQLFWGTTMLRQSETTSTRIKLVGDNQFHEYRVELGDNTAWRGVVVSLRFDPATRPGAQFALDYLRFE